MHNWKFDIVQWEYAQCKKVVNEEYTDLHNWLKKHNYTQIASKLSAEHSVYEFLLFRCRQLRAGNLSAEETARLNNPAQDVL